MKPTPQISHNQHAGFPLTDYNFQATTEAPANAAAALLAAKSPAFHKLSSEFFGAETSWDYVVELLFFILITGLAVWPVVSMLVAVTRMVRGY